jgi:hypothetical protein
MAAPKARVFLLLTSTPASIMGKKNPIKLASIRFCLYFCLLIYERHERPNYATPIFLANGRKGRLVESTKIFGHERHFSEKGKGGIAPKIKKSP